jgi:hypothetical protein
MMMFERYIAIAHSTLYLIHSIYYHGYTYIRKKYNEHRGGRRQEVKPQAAKLYLQEDEAKAFSSPACCISHNAIQGHTFPFSLSFNIAVHLYTHVYLFITMYLLVILHF